jgi:hypothetical protein
MNNTLLKLIEGATPFESRPLVAMAKDAKKLADEAWGKAAEAGARGDDDGSAYWRGRAHAFCEVLGDQEALLRMGALD